MRPPKGSTADAGAKQATISSFFPGTKEQSDAKGKRSARVAEMLIVSARLRGKSAAADPKPAATKKQKQKKAVSSSSKVQKSCSTKHPVSYPSSIRHHGETYTVGDGVYLISTDNLLSLPDGTEGDQCCVCHSDERLEEVVECSRCLGGFHLDCQKPKLKKIPEGDWLCPGCNRGDPVRNRPMRTAAEKFLFEDDILQLVLITAFVHNRLGDGQTEISCIYFTRPEDTYLGRQKHHGAREVFLQMDEHFEHMDSIFGPAIVVQPQDFDDTEGCDVFVCEYEYDEKWKRFRRREVRTTGAGKGATRHGCDSDASDADQDWAMSSGDESDGDNVKNDRSYTGQPTVHALWAKAGLLKGIACPKRPNAIKGTRRAANRYQNIKQEEEGPNLLGQGVAAVPMRAPAGPVVLARNALALSSIPTSLPCRDQEKAHIARFVQEAVGPDSAGSPGVLYICGVPGTGKTACVMEVLNSQYSNATNVQMVTLNALSLPSPQHVYSKLWEKLTGQRFGPARALAALEAQFSPTDSTTAGAMASKQQRQMTTLLLVDEIDVLITKDQAVLYNLFEWPTRPGSRLAVMGISNTHDLDSRVLPRIASRLSNSKLAFNPYSMAQLKSIVTDRLSGMDVVADAAIDLAVRKVASSTGDVRRALELLRRSLDMADAELRKEGKAPTTANCKGLVTSKHVLRATVETYASIHMQFLRSCSRLEKLIMVALMLEMRATKKQEASARALHHRLHTHLGLLMPEAKCQSGTLVALLAGLGSKRLLLTDPAWRHINMKVSFNVTVDDVVVALKEDAGLAPVHSQLGV